MISGDDSTYSSALMSPPSFKVAGLFLFINNNGNILHFCQQMNILYVIGHRCVFLLVVYP